MPVFVDQPKHAYGRMIMCHMLADEVSELHAMADKIGIQRKWFQSDASIPHYDICKAKRKLAIKYGAQSLTWNGLKNFIRNYKEKKHA